MPDLPLAVNASPHLLGSILDELDDLGHNRAHVFQAAGVTRSEHMFEAELSAMQRSTLFNYACCLLATESGHGQGGQGFVQKSVTDMLMYCVITCKDLNEVIQRTAAFCSMVESIGIVLRLEHKGALVELSIELGRPASKSSSLLLTLAAMSTFYHLFSWLIATDLPLEQLGLSHMPPSKQLPVGVLHSQPTRYQCTSNHFTFSTAWLSRPVARSYDQLKQVIDYFPVSLLSASTSEQKLSARVQNIIQTSLNGSLTPVTAEITAQLVNLSPATLRRKLRNEGTDFTQLLNLCLHAQAQQYLIRQVPIKTIALQLGFSDDRAFRRAFKRWHGQTPTEFKQHIQSSKV
ncbi:MAG: AraC family transcriptional regulator [Gammaproteobacteria bacterium]|nr:AraC family transcriptional regulator [Gammaproteobacteria bacterium]